MEERKAAFLKAAKGVCVATGATLLCMVLLALVVVFLRISDNALFLMNQLAKVASIFAGAYFAVGPGGQRGFVTGAAVGFVYMVLGYSVYWAFHGSVSAPLVMIPRRFLFGYFAPYSATANPPILCPNRNTGNAEFSLTAISTTTFTSSKS